MAEEPVPKTVDITQGGLLGKLLRYTPVYLISSTVIAFSAFLLLPINLRIFTEDEYGAIATLDSTSDLVIILVSINLLSAFSRYYYEYKDNPADLTRYVSTIYWFIAGWGLVAVIGAIVISPVFLPNIIPTWPVLVLAFSAVILIQLGQVGGLYLRLNHRPGLQVSLNLANFLTHAVVMVILVGSFSLGLAGKYTGVLAGGVLSAAIGTYVLYREGLLRFRFSWPMLRESLLYSIPLLPYVTSGWITGVSDRILLSIYGTLKETGVYNVGYLLGRGITIFSEAIFMVYGPMIFAMIKKDPVSAKARIERFVPYFFTFMAWIFLALNLFAPEIVMIVVPGRYSGALLVTPVVLLAYLISSQSKTLTSLLSYEKKTVLISAGAILQAAINFGANLILIPIYGKMAAAWTTVAALAGYFLWSLFWSQKYFRLEFDYRRILITLLAVITTGAAGLFLTSLPVFKEALWAGIGVKLALLAGATAVIWFSGGVLAVDKRQILDRLKRS